MDKVGIPKFAMENLVKEEKKKKERM